MRITVIRHLPTEWNINHKLQGKKDIPILPITDELQKEIDHNLAKLNTLSPPNIVVTSSLQRTQQTAFAYGYQPEVEPLLNELDFGRYEGRNKIELIQASGELWFTNPLASIIGENIKDLEQRINLFIEKYGHFHHVLAFGHGSWIRALISLIETDEIKQMNTITLSNNEWKSLTVTKGGKMSGKHIV